MQNPGMVYLVGAGPGDLGLVTQRARELIRRANVLVYDYLVHPDMVEWVRSDCEVVYVGKKAGFHSMPQDEIEALLVKHAKAGKRVVRLKGGDPYVFGRGGEEARALAADGIAFEVVPGITAALAAGAYAGIPLTQRNTSSSLVLVTGHEDPTKHELQVDWPQLGALKNTTLAIYMGMSRLSDILAGLREGGLAADTPAAVVQWASLGRQRSAVGTVSDIVDRVAEAGLKAPSVIFIGEVVTHQQSVDWFENLSLFGRRVVVTRTRGGNSVLRSKLEHLGAEVIELPLINVVPAVEKEALVDVFSELGMYDWVVFTSANGVRIFFEHFLRAFDDIRALGLLRFACVGDATAEEIERHRVKVECKPKIATAEGLAEALIATGSLDSAKIIAITGNLNRDSLVKKLEAARAIVDILPLYRTEKLDMAESAAAQDFRERGADAVLFASSSAADAFADQTEELSLGAEAAKPLFGSMGPQTSETMKERGLEVDFESRKPGLDGFIAKLIETLDSTAK
ncbi:MAG: uroporphyrinogen-III C-methyltransferase [Opitutaceae bacterium]|jgi:uroporphyrinogen III methyltransferase / synthase|nr:uroporphyrinogen-III C-methyltransferase [Opitutaceae bacterium]